MKLSSALLAVFACVLAGPALAQSENLTEEQLLGRRLLFQHCGICHARSGPLAAPKLHMETVTGTEAAIHTFIAEGTTRMPGFKHMFTPAQIDAIIAYLKTVPKPPPEPAGAAESAVPAD